MTGPAPGCARVPTSRSYWLFPERKGRGHPGLVLNVGSPSQGLSEEGPRLEEGEAEVRGYPCF